MATTTTKTPRKHMRATTPTTSQTRPQPVTPTVTAATIAHQFLASVFRPVDVYDPDTGWRDEAEVDAINREHAVLKGIFDTAQNEVAVLRAKREAQRHGGRPTNALMALIPLAHRKKHPEATRLDVLAYLHQCSRPGQRGRRVVPRGTPRGQNPDTRKLDSRVYWRDPTDGDRGSTWWRDIARHWDRYRPAE